MEPIMDWGVAVILWIQQLRPAFDGVFEAITFTGDEMFFLLFMPLTYWCVNRRAGARLTLIFLISVYINAAAKVIAGQPRPYQYDLAVWAYDHVGMGGFPSGHTQNAVVVWGYLAAQIRRKWAWIVAGAMMVFVPFSRLYLGVHFPHDLLGGYVIGGTILLLFLRWEQHGELRLARMQLRKQLALAIGVPVLLLALFWHEDGVTAGAMLLGMGMGFVLQPYWVGFEVPSVWWKRIACYALGAVVIVGLWAGLKAAFGSSEPALLFRFIRYTSMGLWGSIGAPWVFVRLGLAPGRHWARQ